MRKSVSSLWVRMAAIGVFLLGLAVTLCTTRSSMVPHISEPQVFIEGSGVAADHAETTYPQRSLEKKRSCWVFNHMNKAGGSTVKYMLQPWIEENNVTLGLYDSPQWQQGKSFADEYLDNSFNLTWGAYTEGLRPYARADDCKWFTIFRHPVPRLVSAYFYCKKSPDSLCAAVALNSTEASLLQFAKHWGNYGMRQFALAFVRPEDALATEIEPCVTGAPKACPGWYKLKLYMDSLQSRTDGEVSLSVNDVVMHDLLGPIEDLLSTAYAAVGVLEHWETTTHLFNAALELPGYDWPTGFRKIGKKNGDGKFHTQEQEALTTAWTDPEIKKYMWLDLLLYDHAVAVHRRQVTEYGLA